jgi:hypothetical protein
LIDVNSWLKRNPTYTLHFPVARRYETRRVVVNGIDEQWQADLVDLQKLAKYNSRKKYLLVCIDVFSKYGWVEALKTKSGSELKEKFMKIFAEGRIPKTIQTDRGGEFLNGLVQNLLKNNDVKFFTTFSERKASVVERFNRTLKSTMFKYFTQFETRKYVNVLPDLVSRYNSSYHRSIKMRPIDMNKENELTVWVYLYGERNEKKNLKKSNNELEVGDSVRISLERGTFHKSYLDGWSEEIFTVNHKLDGSPVVYKIKDDDDESLDGIFYKQELQKVTKPSSYKIEKIIRKKKSVGGSWLYFVKWKGYPEKFNSFVHADDIKQLQK